MPPSPITRPPARRVCQATRARIACSGAPADTERRALHVVRVKSFAVTMGKDRRKEKDETDEALGKEKDKFGKSAPHERRFCFFAVTAFSSSHGLMTGDGKLFPGWIASLTLPCFAPR